MENCPSCDKKLNGIEDFPKVFLHSVSYLGFPGTIISTNHEQVNITSEQESRMHYNEEGNFLVDSEGSQYEPTFGSYYLKQRNLARFITEEFKKDTQLNSYIDFLVTSQEETIDHLAALVSWKKVKPARIRVDLSYEPAQSGEKSRFLSVTPNYNFELEFEELVREGNIRTCSVNLYGVIGNHQRNPPTTHLMEHVYDIGKLANLLTIQYSGVLLTGEQE